MWRHTLPFLLVAALIPVTGCGIPFPPPAASVAKFIRPAKPVADASTPSAKPHKGQVGASMSAPFIKIDDGDVMMLPFYSEATLSWWGERNYDATVTVGNLKASYEGNLIIADNGNASLGILHGTGVGAIIDIDESEHIGLHDFSVGLLGQFSRGDTGFMSAKYTYGIAYVTDSDEDIEPTHYATVNFGFRAVYDTWSVVYELVVMSSFTKDEEYDEWYDSEEKWVKNIAVMPTLTVSAPF